MKIKKRTITVAISILIAGFLLSYTDYRRVAYKKTPIFAVKVKDSESDGIRAYIGIFYTAYFYNQILPANNSMSEDRSYHREGAEYNHWFLPLQVSNRSSRLILD